jgi:hypothetical protein
VSVYRAMRAYREATDRADCPLSFTARHLWANLAGRADYDGACWPDVATICAALGGISRWTVQRAVAELVAFGVLDVIVARGRGRRNTYRLELAPEGNGAPTHRFTEAETVDPHPVSAPSENEENGAPVHENGAPVHPHIGEVVKRSRREPSPRTIEENGAPTHRFQEDARTTYEEYAAKKRAAGERVLTPAVYFSIMSEADR